MNERVAFIDSHSGGEPTRLILDGGPDLGRGDLAQRAEVFRSRHDQFRAGAVEEPRGSDVFVGALLCPPCDPTNTAGVIFFNNVDTLGMCGHGMIGVVASLYYLGRIRPGTHRMETPVGTVEALLAPTGEVSIANVPSYRFRDGVEIEVPGVGGLTGEIAWGGNWFFILPAPDGVSLEYGNAAALVELTQAIRDVLDREQIRGAGGAEIDHVELYGPTTSEADCRNFVLCPGGAWDRSPCGTGTSAKMACLASSGELSPGQPFRQESPVGSIFEGLYEIGSGGKILPTIRGRAHVMSEGHLVFEEHDPFRGGLAP